MPRPATGATPLAGIDVYRVYSPDDIGSERGMHRAMTCDSGHRGKCRCPDDDLPVAFSTLLVTAVTTMAFTVIDDFQYRRLKCAFQSAANLLRKSHYFFLTPSI